MEIMKKGSEDNSEKLRCIKYIFQKLSSGTENLQANIHTCHFNIFSKILLKKFQKQGPFQFQANSVVLYIMRELCLCVVTHDDFRTRAILLKLIPGELVANV